MKYLYIILTIGLIACSSTNLNSFKQFKMSNAEVQGWVRGKELVGQANSGTSYTTYFKYNEGVKIKHCWLGKYQYPFSTRIRDGQLLVIVNKLFGEFNNKLEDELTKNYEGEGLIEYEYQDKIYYQVIDEFIEKKASLGE